MISLPLMLPVFAYLPSHLDLHPFSLSKNNKHVNNNNNKIR